MEVLYHIRPYFVGIILFYDAICVYSSHTTEKMQTVVKISVCKDEQENMNFPNSTRPPTHQLDD